MTVQDIYVAIAIWGKDISSLKGKTTRKNTIPVAEDLIQVPKEIIKLHRYIIMTADILFVNTVPFFLILNRKNFFTMVHNIADSKAKTIHTTFNEVYIFYINRLFSIINMHKDG